MAGRKKSKRHLIDDQTRKKLIRKIEEIYFTDPEIDSKDIDSNQENRTTHFIKEELGEYWRSVTDNIGKEALWKILYRPKAINGFFEITEYYYGGLARFMGQEVLDEILEESSSKVVASETEGKRCLTYYYYDEKDDVAGISQGLMVLTESKENKGSGTVLIKDKAHSNNQDLLYEGTYAPTSNNTMLLMTLKTKEDKKLDLHVLLHKGALQNQFTKVMLGQYHNIGVIKNTIISGTIIAEPQNKFLDYHSFQATFLSPKDDEYSNIHQAIRKYLAKKANNRIKVPSGLSTHQLLEKLFREKRDTYNANKGIISSVFISSPATSLTEDKYRANRQEILAIRNHLEQKYGWECFSAIIECEKFEDFKESYILYDQINQQLSECDLFVMILGDCKTNRVSSCFIELGHALSRKIPCTLFIHEDIYNDEMTPNLIKGAIENAAIKKCEFKQLSEICSKIDTNGNHIFGFND